MRADYFAMETFYKSQSLGFSDGGHFTSHQWTEERRQVIPANISSFGFYVLTTNRLKPQRRDVARAGGRLHCATSKDLMAPRPVQWYPRG